jgi:hypothetical protein
VATKTSRILRIFRCLALGLRPRARSVMLGTYMSKASGPRFGSLLGLVSALAGAAGCGHPASEAECQTIVERIVELELKAQNVTDTAEIAKRRNESLGTSADGGRSEVLQGCIGRHITDGALACVRRAESASEITDHCLQ